MVYVYTKTGLCAYTSLNAVYASFRILCSMVTSRLAIIIAWVKCHLHNIFIISCNYNSSFFQ